MRHPRLNNQSIEVVEERWQLFSLQLFSLHDGGCPNSKPKIVSLFFKWIQWHQSKSENISKLYKRLKDDSVRSLFNIRRNPEITAAGDCARPRDIDILIKWRFASSRCITTRHVLYAMNKSCNSRFNSWPLIHFLIAFRCMSCPKTFHVANPISDLEVLLSNWSSNSLALVLDADSVWFGSIKCLASSRML